MEIIDLAGYLRDYVLSIIFMHGMSWTAAGDASLIVSLNPVFTVLLAAPMLHQKITGRMSL